MPVTKKRVALINPPFSKLIYGEERSIKSVTPCLGLFYLQSYCRDIAEIEVFEGEFYSDMENLIREVNTFRPDILGVTTNTSTYPLCAQLAREVDASIKVAGGPYASFRVGECLIDFDAVFVGDAELGLHALISGASWAQVPGLAFKDESGRIQQNPARIINDLDEIPFPDHSRMQLGLYQASPHRELSGNFATMMTTRGCGFQCSFCLSAKGGMNDGKYRVRSVKNVIDEIGILTTQYDVKSIQFWDDTFTMAKRRTREMCNALRAIGIEYVCNTRTDRMDEETADLLAQSGCQGVFFGVESGDQEISDRNMLKGVRREQVSKAVACCRKAGVRTTTSFIFGAIDDTEETIDESIRFALELDSNYVLFNIYTAHPGTHGWAEALREGIIDNYTVDIERWKGEPAGVPTTCRQLSRAALHSLKAEAYVRYYTQKDPIGYAEIIDTYNREIDNLRLSGDWQVPHARKHALKVL